MSLEPAEVQFEPDLLGFGYKGRHTNIYADVRTQATSGDVLDATMELRAIPVAYHWDYGDGTSRTTYEPGEPLSDYDGTGEEINKMDFKTPTSHVYEETGIFEVTVTTEFIGQYRFDGGEWTGIPGSISVESSPGEADIWTQNSRWVSGACESRDQWGCNGPVQFDPSTDRPPKIYQDQYDENGRWLGPID
ncbi:PKD domain-containing protein [Nesterenkonia sp. F]|uniref:PKD domain-containing protein n=1 Tax=Nesterenkonia sp. F TaxID=795955 RepID=UPI000255C9F3|nr:PKD domain-containing protein [Nesterenkonia sp. F]